MPFPPPMFRALRHRNYLLFFSGNLVSLVGTWMQMIAQSWLVYRLTSSELLLGWVGFASQLPSLFVTPLGGVVADRCNRRRALILTQTLQTVQALILAGLTLSGTVTVGQIMALSLFLGVVNAFDMPLRHAIVLELVEDKKDLSNAIAMNSLMFNCARLLGPALAGFVIAWAGEGYCFLFNGVSFFAILFSLGAIRLSRRPAATPPSPWRRNLSEGLSYAWNFPAIRSILLLVALLSLLAMPYSVLLPIFARDILHGDSRTMGILMGAAGTGALAGGFYLASRKGVIGLEKVTVLTTVMFSLGLMAFSQSRTLGISLALLVLIGFGMVTQMATCNTILQTVTDDDKRGRVMSLFTTAFMGTAPFGSLLAGWLASRLTAPVALLLCGGTGMLCSLLLVDRQAMGQALLQAVRAQASPPPTS